MVKKAVKKRKLEEIETKKDDNVIELPPKRMSDEPIPKKVKWINKQRVLVFASRGISFRDRHLMEDIKKLMPHHKSESKMERSKTLSVINEMCEMKHCNKVILFEGRKKRDLYMWLSNIPNGPSVKFLVENVYTMAELKLTGNCLRGSRPLLSFDPSFKEKPHYHLLKELLSQIFGVPNHHPKSQPFFDHIYSFTILDNRIWFRNFQILSEDGALAEVGPRFVLNPIKIFSGSFGGSALWENASYVSPARYRQQINLAAKNKYVNRLEQKVHAEATKPKESYKLTPLDDIFKGDPYEKAKQMENEINEVTENEQVVEKTIRKVSNTKKTNSLKLVEANLNKKKKINARKQNGVKITATNNKKGSPSKNNKKGSPNKNNKMLGKKAKLSTQNTTNAKVISKKVGIRKVK